MREVDINGRVFCRNPLSQREQEGEPVSWAFFNKGRLTSKTSILSELAFHRKVARGAEPLDCM